MNKHQERILAAQVYHTFKGDKGPNNVKLVPFQHIITARVTSTTIDFVESSKDKVVGIQTFDSDKLPANKDLIIANIKAEYATAATDAGLIASSDYSASAPSSLVCGEFKISQGDRGVVSELLFDAMINNDTTNNNTDKALDLPDMPIIKGDMSFEAQGKIPVALAGGVDHYVKITMIGYTPKTR